MKKALSLLWELQKLEQKKRKLLAERKSIQNKESELLAQEVVEIAKKIAGDREILIKLQHSNDKQEKELAFMSKEYQELEKKLYGDNIKSAKELEQLQKKIDAAKQEIASKEEKVYSELEKTDNLSARIQSNEQLVTEKKVLRDKKQREMNEWLIRNKAQCDEIDEACATIIEGIDKNIWGKYLELSRKIPQPIAKLENGICSGCRLSVPERQIVNSMGQLVYCDNCGRIIFSE